MTDDPKTTVYYDGSCPLCTREIAFYRKRANDDAVAWVDISACGEGEVAPGLTKDDAMARFHVRGSDGRLASGAEAFANLWTHVPGWRWLGRVVSLAPIRWIADRVYSAFLVFRPRLQRFFVKRDANKLRS